MELVGLGLVNGHDYESKCHKTVRGSNGRDYDSHVDATVRAQVLVIRSLVTK